MLGVTVVGVTEIPVEVVDDVVGEAEDGDD